MPEPRRVPGAKARRRPTRFPYVDQVRWLTQLELEALEERFRSFARESARFREDVLTRTGLAVEGGSAANVLVNLELVRTVFAKWSLDAMVVLYAQRSAGFAELRRLLPGISSRVLSMRLKALEGLGFVERTVMRSRPPRVAYVLTHDGHTVSRLGEPLFLYLRTRRAYGRHATHPGVPAIPAAGPSP